MVSLGGDTKRGHLIGLDLNFVLVVVVFLLGLQVGLGSGPAQLLHHGSLLEILNVQAVGGDVGAGVEGALDGGLAGSRTGQLALAQRAVVEVLAVGAGRAVIL